MKYNSKIHNKEHLIKAIIGNLFSVFNYAQPNQLLVLNYHGTQLKFLPNFKKQISFLKTHYELISPAEFFDYINKTKKIKGRKILLTFDDGVLNNRYAIEELNKQGISAIFFIVPNFINTTKNEQKFYFINYIRPTINNELDSETEDFDALQWADLKNISLNHILGSHTLTHTMVKDKLNENELQNEVLKSKELIKQQLNIEITSFCSINNTALTIGKVEQQLIIENYDYHFTTFGGNNINCNSHLIKRINIESHWLLGAVKFALSPIEFFRWKKKFEKFTKDVA